MQANLLANSAGTEDVHDGIAGHSYMWSQMPEALLHNATRANPLVFLDGCVRVAMAAAPPMDATAQLPCHSRAVAPPEKLALRYRTPVVAPHDEPRKRAAPAAPLSAPPAAKTAVIGPARGPGAAKKENKEPQKGQKGSKKTPKAKTPKATKCSWVTPATLYVCRRREGRAQRDCARVS